MWCNSRVKCVIVQGGVWREKLGDVASDRWGLEILLTGNTFRFRTQYMRCIWGGIHSLGGRKDKEVDALYQGKVDFSLQIFKVQPLKKKSVKWCSGVE